METAPTTIYTRSPLATAQASRASFKSTLESSRNDFLPFLFAEKRGADKRHRKTETLRLVTLRYEQSRNLHRAARADDLLPFRESSIAPPPRRSQAPAPQPLQAVTHSHRRFQNALRRQRCQLSHDEIVAGA